MPEDFMRGVVYAFLLGHGFLGGRHKVLKKVPKSNNMNKLMGDDIECESEKFNMDDPRELSFRLPSYRMICA